MRTSGKGLQTILRGHAMRGRAILLATIVLATLCSGVVQAQQPDIVQEHIYHTHAQLTLDVNAWADDHPDIVDLTSAGETVLGRALHVVRISDWSVDTKPDGTKKEVVYIDGGHHGNEHLGTALAFLVAEHYIEGWAEGDEAVVKVLQTTELHILVMLNADGNDMDTRWNVRQVDLNRNYDHHWNEHDETQPGSGPFSEPETTANGIYMREVVPNADLYVTMHTGVWIMLYPWGIVPDQPVDWELFHYIRDVVHDGISDIPIQNANQGLYPNSGTSRDYGYGVMGFPTFTFETDDEQWLPGTTEPLSSRLGEELDVMEYLIENVWYWRARLEVASLVIGDDEVAINVENLGHATTANASLEYHNQEGEVLWASSMFTVNASANAAAVFPFKRSLVEQGGTWNLNYQKRVIDAAQWVNESVPSTVVNLRPSIEGSALPFGTAPLLVASLIAAVAVERKARERDEDNDCGEH
jgi:hypothetical protein